MVKKAIKKGLIFFTIVMLIIIVINPIFVEKNSQRGKLIDGLYKDTKDNYDVVLMGSSHMNGGVDPNVLWHEYGITSYNYATGGQPIDVTYYLLKEVLKKHKNPIVVVDLYYLGLTDEYGDEGYIRNDLDNMKFSLNKLEAIENCVPLKSRMSYIFPILEYHDRWQELTKEDFNYDSSKVYYEKGFEAGENRYGKDKSISTPTTETADIPSRTKEYLNKIIDLSKKDGFKLVFVNMPCDDKKSDGDLGNWVKDPQKMFNKVAQIAKSNNIPFINYNTDDKMKSINLDFKNDMNNYGHLNIWGANKVSDDLGEFLKDNYKLADHRGDSKYAEWDIDYEHSQVASISK
ncbi:hypothetical protein [Clostridium hydrogenum]|uniref:hypothetical protein n=1 Tax=Clostridium hydrogenum TaxID=2855764 RepID=UPI002E2FE022|nr:hypothetical protein [Clostridium hydrogenum]